MPRKETYRPTDVRVNFNENILQVQDQAMTIDLNDELDSLVSKSVFYLCSMQSFLLYSRVVL